MKMRVALLETDEQVAHMNHLAANPVSDAPPPGTKWAKSDTKRRIWYAMACSQHRRLLSLERASRGAAQPRPPCDMCRLVRFAIVCHVGAMENPHMVADLIDFTGGPLDARAPPDKATHFQAIMDDALFDSKFWHRLHTPLRRPVCGKCGTVTPDSPSSGADHGYPIPTPGHEDRLADDVHVTLQAYWSIVSSAAKICGGDQKSNKPRPLMMAAMRRDNPPDNSHDAYVEWTKEHASQ